MLSVINEYNSIYYIFKLYFKSSKNIRIFQIQNKYTFVKGLMNRSF